MHKVGFSGLNQSQDYSVSKMIPGQNKGGEAYKRGIPPASSNHGGGSVMDNETYGGPRSMKELLIA